jgi:hypothetical protein
LLGCVTVSGNGRIGYDMRLACRPRESAKARQAGRLSYHGFPEPVMHPTCRGRLHGPRRSVECQRVAEEACQASPRRQAGRTGRREPMNQTWESDSTSPQRVECRASREPAVRKIIVAAMLMGMAAVCFADRNNWPRPEANEWNWDNPSKVAGYVANNWGPWLMFPLGVAILAWALLGLRRKLLADESGIGYVGGRKIAWSQVDQLDARKLQSKGFVVLRAAGRRMVLDSYHLTNFREMMSLVERQVPAEKQILK